MSLLADALREASTTSGTTGRTTATDGADPGRGDDNAPGLLDLVAEAEVQMEGITKDMADVDAAVADLAAMMELVAEDMARVTHPGARMSAKLTVMHQLAKALDGPAGELESATERLAERMNVAASALNAFMEWAEATPRGQWPDGLTDVLRQLVEAPSETGPVDFQEAMSLMHTFGASSRLLRAPARRIGASFQTLFGYLAVMEEWRTTAVRLRQG
ncbi:hypothetical protein ABZ714_24355 [Streptomyces sp. NPDC006798]|uniref:hypothetical protein n=1 Tax=Streptomyces sp. NPDC006798 TaxID=3155462 RepID=UPI0033C97574